MNSPISNFIESSLLHPPVAISYIAGARLREAYPDKAVVEFPGCGYMKELCLAAVMAWMNTDAPSTIDRIAKAQAESLLAQVNHPAEVPPADPQLTRKEQFRKLITGEA